MLLFYFYLKLLLFGCILVAIASIESLLSLRASLKTKTMAQNEEHNVTVFALERKPSKASISDQAKIMEENENKKIL